MLIVDFIISRITLEPDHEHAYQVYRKAIGPTMNTYDTILYAQLLCCMRRNYSGL